MKQVFYLFLALVTVVGLFPKAGAAVTGEYPLVVDLIAGQNTDVGDIRVWDDGEFLYVEYTTVEPWCFTETHLAVASNLDDIPQQNGNPIPGQFPYSDTHDCASSFTYTVPLIQNSCELYIAAHAAVNSGETAWGAGLGFPGANWGTYFLYEPTPCNNTPTPTFTNTPSATSTYTATATMTATSTPVPTNTPTATSTIPSCQPVVVNANFSQIQAGQSVEGMSAVAPNLNINAKRTAIKVLEGASPTLYFARIDGASVINGNLAAGGGFGDQATQMAKDAPLYIFTFAPQIRVVNFSLHMLDFGDWNPSLSATHRVSMIAYDASNTQVATQVLQYTTPPVVFPTTSNLYGNLVITGDAGTAQSGQPGNWIWNVSGDEIAKVVVRFGVGFDPNFGFDKLKYTRCQ